jgi:tetratricopeptide (TPR) repeat protein
MTHSIPEIVCGIVALVITVGFIGWVLVCWLKRSDDPARLIFKWALTAPVVFVLLFWVGPMATSSMGGAFIGVPLAGACGIMLAALWRHNIADLLSKPFTSLYDGGSAEPTPMPAYSIAQAKQKKGNYLEAIAEIRKQLDRFPTDVEGQMLLAQIQAEDLKDLPAAELTIEHFCAQHGHAPQNIVYALYSLADWHLQISQDREAAQRELQKIIDLFPESEFALGAAHRIAHLGSPEMLLASHEERKFIVPEGVRNLGLLRGRGPFQPAEPKPEEMAAEYVKHLERHPLDTEAREKLAVIYADHYGRLDMAAGELEQMIGQPNQPGRLVVHWLNLLADLQIRHGASYETVRETLQRIVDRDPKAAPAELARSRQALLKLEMKSKDQSQAVKLGSYEQNIGLKRGLPRRG